MSARETLFGPIFDQNPVMLQVLGICSALAITNSLHTSLIMCLALTSVLVFSAEFACGVGGRTISKP